MATYGGMWSLTCGMLCAYSIGAPIGAGLISREKHYDPLLAKKLELGYISIFCQCEGDAHCIVVTHFLRFTDQTNHQACIMSMPVINTVGKFNKFLPQNPAKIDPYSLILQKWRYTFFKIRNSWSFDTKHQFLGGGKFSFFFAKGNFEV